MRYHHRVEKAAISIQRRYRVIYAALQSGARARERERVEKAKKKAEKDRKARRRGGPARLKSAVPDHGKRAREPDRRDGHGWGSRIGERWVPLDDKTRPHRALRAPSAERALQVRADPALQERRRVQEQRAALVARLRRADMRQRQAEAAVDDGQEGAASRAMCVSAARRGRECWWGGGDGVAGRLTRGGRGVLRSASVLQDARPRAS